MSSDDERRLRGRKRERTRAALVAATVEVLREKGFAGVSLDEVAFRAGMTKGAIYSNFAGKADLLLEAMRAQGLTLTPPEQPPASLAEAVDALAQGLADMVGRARREGAFLAEFQLQALADPELRRGLGELYAANFGASAAALAALPDLGPGMTPREVAVTLQSVALGFLAQSFLTPDEVTPATIAAAFSALARGLAKA
ncbi:MAG TPA: helix-turn-helix domain-containing protein [Caulobacteraceae bacterium]|nr:helix-turn-helix domain-containing protein [Caulobacteraceae bacterium]